MATQRVIGPGSSIVINWGNSPALTYYEIKDFYFENKGVCKKREQQKTEIKRQADKVWNTDFYNNGFNVI